MPVVVSDTSPLRALAHVGRVGLLRDLFGDVYVPPAVVRELGSPKQGMPAVDVADYEYIVVRSPEDAVEVRRLLELLDAGESEALALARELDAAFVLIDESDGRGVAKGMGLNPLGAIGVLLRAKRAGLIEAIGPEIERLRGELRFFVSDALHQHALRLAGEA